MRTLSIAACLAIAVAAAACTDGAPGRTASELILVRVAMIGANDASGAELQSPQAIGIGPARHVFVHDYGAQQVKEYDFDGRFIRAVGRKGQGPGEFQNVHHLGFLGDTMWTVDVDQERLTKFPPDSSRVLTHGLRYDPHVQGLLVSAPIGILESGLTLAEGSFFGAALKEATTVRSPVTLLRLDGTVADTVAVLEYPVFPFLRWSAILWEYRG